MTLVNASNGPQRLHVSTEHGHDISEGQVGIANAGVGVAAAAGDDHIG